MEEEKAKTVDFLSHKLLVDEDGNNLLHQAALEGKNQNVKVFLENELFDLEAKNYLGETALSCALKMENDETFQLLSDFGADLSQTFQNKNGKMRSSISRDEDGNTLLHRAVLKNSCVNIILENNRYELEAKNRKKETALHCAARTGHVGVVGLLIEKGVELEARDEHGETSLFTAIKHQHEQVVKHLIISGADLHAQNNNQDTPLHLASLLNNAKIVQLLLERKPGADLEARNNTQQTPIHHASFIGNTKIVQLLLERKANIEARDHNGETPLFKAIEFGHDQVAEELIISGANLEIRNVFQETPLHFASLLNNTKIVQLLLERKPNLHEAKDRDGNTPLFKAIFAGLEQVAEQLIMSGADLTTRNNHQHGLLQLASCMGNTKIVQLLLERKPNLEAIDDDGDTPLCDAIIWGHYEIVKLLHGAGASLNATSKNGKTLLHKAASSNCLSREDNKRIVEFLLENKANIAAKDNDKNIPLHDAGLSNCHIVKLLIDGGSNLDAKNDSGETPPRTLFL